MSEIKKDTGENKIIKRTEQITSYLGITNNPELSRLVAERIRQDEIDKQLEVQIRKHLKDTWEIGLAALPQILTLLASITPWGFAATTSGFLVSVLGREQQKKWLEEILEKIDITTQYINEKNCRFRLSFDEFIEYFVQASDIVSKSSSEEKRKALANLVVNSALAQGDKVTGEGIAIRLISQMTNEEMRLLIGIHELEITSKYKEHIRVVELAKKLNLSEEKTNLICEGLIQLNLVVDPVVDGGVMEAGKIYGKPYHDCCTTGLAQNLLNWCAEEVPTA